MLLQTLGALVALSVVLYSSYSFSQRVSERVASQQRNSRAAERTRSLKLIESELEQLEALKSPRTAEDDEAYARLIRRRNHLVAA